MILINACTIWISKNVRIITIWKIIYIEIRKNTEENIIVPIEKKDNMPIGIIIMGKVAVAKRVSV